MTPATSIVRTETGCWEWTKAKAAAGYGVMSFYKRMVGVHRVAYRLFHGEIPNGMVICHKCDNPPCFNPEHLFLGTQKDNVHDMLRKGRLGKVGARGERNSHCKFTDEVVAKIRADFALGLPPRDLKAAYNISSAQLYRITRNQVRTA